LWIVAILELTRNLVYVQRASMNQAVMTTHTREMHQSASGGQIDMILRRMTSVLAVAIGAAAIGAAIAGVTGGIVGLAVAGGVGIFGLFCGK
jgi:hypothetical protein